MDSKQHIIDRLTALRIAMAEAGINAVIIPQNDPHQSEYIARHWQTRRYLSGFTGSAGDLVVTATKALLWTDSRYFIQAADQLAGTDIVLMKDRLPQTPSIADWLAENIAAGATVGIDGMMFSHSAVASLRRTLDKAGIGLVTDFDPIDALWPDRPSLPIDPVYIHDIKYAGTSAADKIAGVLDNAKRQGASAVILSDLAEIAWTLNIRSSDVTCNPVAISYLYLAPDQSVLFIDPRKVDDTVKAHLAETGVAVAPYAEVFDFLRSNPSTAILVDESNINERLLEAVGAAALAGSSPVAVAKACKNRVQVEGIRRAMERDGAALVYAFMDIERHLAEGRRLTELGVAELLLKYRSACDMFVDLSFETIAGYAHHGAIVHYSATPETDIELRPEGLLLIDSGAQYLDGTTDITRTISLGAPTARQRTDFTLVLKGYIALDTAIYPEGTRGAQLDALARMPLWRNGMTYLHGTGHGVGHFLNVHEGPQTIRLNDTPTPLMPGMVTSDEPGVYREGVHGIRCENLLLTVPAFTTEFGNFLKFETLTLFPFDLALIDVNMLSADEIRWINDYHATVYARLSPLLTDEARTWLRAKTLPIE